MKRLIAIAALSALLTPVTGSELSRENEFAACVIGHAIVLLDEGLGDVEMAETSAWDQCKKLEVKFQDADEAELFEEHILGILHQFADQ